MLAIQKSCGDEADWTLHILPCRVQYDGPTKVTKRLWTPETQKGRKLRGRAVRLPAKYQGMVLQSTEKILPRSIPENSIIRRTAYDIRDAGDEEDDDNDDDDSEIPEPVKIVEQTNVFDELVVWGHDQLPGADDRFVKGIDEWISLAEAIHTPIDSRKSLEKDGDART